MNCPLVVDRKIENCPQKSTFEKCSGTNSTWHLRCFDEGKMPTKRVGDDENDLYRPNKGPNEQRRHNRKQRTGLRKS